MIRLHDEAQLMNLEFRKLAIQSITSGANGQRKYEHLRRYEVYKDQTMKWVIAALAAEGLKPETIEQMRNRAANISICRKVVNKLARAYAAGVQRDGGADGDTKQAVELARLLSLDDRMRKADRYRELHRNGMIQIVPERDARASAMSESDRYNLRVRVLSPWQYDVIPDQHDHETPRVVIMSDWVEASSIPATEDQAARHGGGGGVGSAADALASSSATLNVERKPVLIWWSDSYHFTTDYEGNIISQLSPEENENPIDLLPFVNNAEEQDGEFWAKGGDDIIDGSILVNKILTDLMFIAYVQGYGQFVITGKNLPERFTLGPNNALVFDYDPKKEDPKPEVSVVTADPPLDAWMRAVEQYVALLLTTNNLSPSNVAARLDATSFPSGIAMLVEMSEATNEIEDKQKQYVAIERAVFERVRRWHDLYREASSLTEEFAAIGQLPATFAVTPRFNEIKPVTTEKDRLEVIKLRKELGINEQIDLVLRDNPDMSREDAEAKLERIAAEASRLIKAGEPKDQTAGDDDQAEGDELEGGVGSGLPTGVDGVNVQKLALNGSQVTSIVEITAAVARAELPKGSAKSILAAAFNLDPTTCAAIIDSIVVGSAAGSGDENPAPTDDEGEAA